MTATDISSYKARLAGNASLQDEVMLAAMNSLDWSAYKNQSEIEYALAQRVSTMLYFMGDKSVPGRMFDAVKLNANIQKVELEESSQRLVVTFTTTTGESEGPESIRTDRIDGPNGAEIEKMWRGLEGKHATIYKTIEQTKDKKKTKVRIAPFARRLR